MAEFIVDEWLWADLNGENGRHKQEEACKFLQILWEKCDKMVTAKGSKFMQKAWDFCKKAIDIEKRAKVKLFREILHNPKKFEEVDVEEIALENLDLSQVDPDDVYLVKTYHERKALIITTDRKLLQCLRSKNILCILRDEFLNEYIKSA